MKRLRQTIVETDVGEAGLGGPGGSKETIRAERGECRRENVRGEQRWMLILIATGVERDSAVGTCDH